MATAPLTSKGQLTLPKEIRERLGLKAGDKVELVPSGPDRVVMRKRRTVELEELLGSLPTNGISLTLEQIDDAIADVVVETLWMSNLLS
jgi:AbrB family looped-hinge helix DNA binding protein